MTPGNVLKKMADHTDFQFAADPGNGNLIEMDGDRKLVALVTGAGSETRTLRHPAKGGLEITLFLMTAGGGTATLTDSDGSSTFDGTNTSMTFTTAGDWVKLISVPASSTTFRWQILNGNGAAATVTTLTASGLITANAGLSIADAQNIALSATTGTMIGTATTQKLGFWSAAPVAQATTGVAAAPRVAGSAGGTFNTDDTYGGYTINKVVKALQLAGILA